MRPCRIAVSLFLVALYATPALAAWSEYGNQLFSDPRVTRVRIGPDGSGGLAISGLWNPQTAKHCVGRQISTNGSLVAHSERLDRLAELPSGVYLLRLTQGTSASIARIAHLR